MKGFCGMVGRLVGNYREVRNCVDILGTLTTLEWKQYLIELRRYSYHLRFRHKGYPVFGDCYCKSLSLISSLPFFSECLFLAEHEFFIPLPQKPYSFLWALNG